MAITLTYGNDVTCPFDARELTHLHPAILAPLAPEKLAADLRTALFKPLGYPSLDSAVVPGDQVVLAIDVNVPEVQSLVRAAISVFREIGIEPNNITVLTSIASESKKLDDDLQSELHDPDDEEKCAMLGVDKSGRIVRLNRTICEADFVLSIGCCSQEFRRPPTQGLSPDPMEEELPQKKPEQPDDSETYSKFPGLFPQFSDRETIERFCAPVAMDNHVHHLQRIEEANEAGWRLGVRLVVQVVPGCSGGVAEILAGDPATVAETAAARYRQIWECETPRRGDLVVASITGEQTWQNFGRAMLAVESVLEEHGTIVLCSQLDQPPGPSLQRLSDSDDFTTAEREIMRDRASDSWPATLLARALEQGSVYFRSHLADDVVESLGMTPIASDEELLRLARVGEHCIVLEHAQRLMPSVANEASYHTESNYLDD